MKAILELDWSMKGHFDTFTEVDSCVNDYNSEFSALGDLFYDFLLIIKSQIYGYYSWLKWKRFMIDLPPGKSWMEDKRNP